MANKIKHLILDVDGTLTDGKIYMGESGELLKTFDIKDGYGIHDMLIPAGITPVIITGRSSRILENRCKELSISNLFQGVKDKVKVLEQYLAANNSTLEEVAYIGDDLNDFLCMQLIKEGGGITGCPADAVTSIVEMSDFVSNKSGGHGAVRDFIEYLLNSR